MTFLEAAYKILKDANRPLHSRKITQIALKRNLLDTSGKTPVATMNALLLLECKKANSRFKKVGPSQFAINPRYKLKKKQKTGRKGKPLSEECVKRAVIKWLTANEWGTNLHFGGPRDHGVDIRVRHNRYSRHFLIEAKGESSSKSWRSQNESSFVYSLGQVITRMNTKGARYYYGLALPEDMARVALRRIPWQVAQKLIIFVFSVNSSEQVKRYTWHDLKRIQKQR